MDCLQINLLYSIKTDDAQDILLDKIDFLNKTTKQFYDNINDGQIIQVKGLFGTQHEVEREIEQQINNKVNLQSYINHSEKGNLIAIKLQNNMLYCLILSENFFIIKPINEKSIEIVLFRILQDLTDNIKLCLNDAILKQNWYQGEVVPFSAQILQRNDYDFAEEQNQEVKLYDCKWRLSSDLSGYEIINSKTLSPKITAIRLSNFDENTFKSAYNEFYEKLLIQIWSTENQDIKYLIPLFQREYQIQGLINTLMDISKDLGKEIKMKKQEFSKKGQSYNIFGFLKSTNDLADPNDFQQKLNQQQSPINYSNNTHQNHESKEDIKELLKQFQNNIQSIKNKYQQKIEDVMKDLKNQTYYEILKVSFKLLRDEDNPSEKVKDIIQNDCEKKIISGHFFEFQISSKFNIIDIFDTKEKSTIYIIQPSDTQNSQTKIFFQSHNSLQFKLIIQFDFKDIEQAVYFYDYNRGHLYIFNFKGINVHQIIITEHGLITSQNNICYQQENMKSFFISQVAFLNYSNKFIILSKDNKLYKQKDQGQDFENVKCNQQFENGTKLTDFEPKIRPDKPYTQLLTCPSGKYFYLANDYGCDRYDLTCMIIENIQIDGPIKIFADFSDVIILGQLKKKNLNSKIAKIISNLVSQKKFNKQENQEKNVIGNPALDIAKGSFIKFGPNSQFLLKEKQKHISLYVNKEYYDIIEPYLNILNVNEIILSSSKLQFAEYKNEQIKNIIFSRVPLQLCTIENSNLIPLNDGFRQQSQTQTIISVDQKVKQLHLGFLEDHLSNYNNKIFVVGIIGKQSSGKSYLLNRVFGTRFSVSSARCTDGVWGSIAYIEDQTFLVLDCEGLFNGARTDKEEIKMLAFLTALCDITILNSDLTFNRHFNDLFNHLVEASKQLNDEKLFKGILYFVLRDVSSTDNQGAEKELLKNLERLKEGGSEEILFLKRLFNNKIAVEKLVNNENKQFDSQLIAVRKYFLDNSEKQNRWKDGMQLVQIMKILLCQLELSDNTNASLIDLQLRIEKIFEKSKRLWYEFDENVDKCQYLKLDQSQYKFQQYNDHQHILMCKDVLKQLYKDLALEDSIQTHNKNLQEAKSQFYQMMEFRKQQIILQTKKETSCIDNQEVQIMIQNKMSMLQSFLVDQMNQYELCFEKCSQCHLFCKQFKNHIEISQQLNKILNDQINSLENQRKNSQIENKDQEEEKRERIISIDKQIKDNENTLEVLEICNQIFEISKKKDKDETEMMQYSFYDKNQQCLNLAFFEIDQKEKQFVPLDKIEELENQIKQLILELQKKKNVAMENIIKQKDQLINYERDNRDKEQSLNLLKISQEKQQAEMILFKQQYIEKKKKLENIQSEILEFDISIDENDIKFQKEQKTQELHQILNQVQEYQQTEKEKTQELQYLKQTDLILYFDSLNQNMQEYEQNYNQLEEEIENLENQKQDLENTREKIKKEQSKKIGKNTQKIEELTQKLNGINEEEINNQLNKCQLRRENLEKSLENVENFDLLKECQQQIQAAQQNVEIPEQEISQQENLIQGGFQNVNTQIQQFQDNVKNQQLVNLFLKNKEEQLNEIQTLVSFNLNRIKEIENSIDLAEQIIVKIIKKNNLSDTQKNLNFEISEIENRIIELEKIQQETIRQLNIQEQNLVEIKNNQEQLILDNKNLQEKYNQRDQKIVKLKSQVDQLESFSIHLNNYKVNSETLKEKQGKLKKCDNFESTKVLEEQQIFTKIQDLKKEINDSKDEKEGLMKQLQNFHQSAIDAEKLKNLLDTQKKLVELELHLHLCQRESHKCDQVCQACPDQICDNKAGHDEQQEHLCNKQDHRCNDKCQIIYCQNTCNKSFKHDSKHNCLNDHPCQKICQYCQKKCKKDLSADPNHTIHDCLDNYCSKNCQLCKRKCSESHQHSIEKSDHFCESVHECEQLCQEKGICKIEYEVNEATWKTEFSEFKYIQYKPICNKKQKCQKQIPVKSNKHDGTHQCKDQTQNQFHQCDQQCPECNTYCDLNYGHQGPHSSDRHRNKENQIFTIQEGYQALIKIKDQQETKIRKYQIGESSAPETCDQSCKRRGRSHFHLNICQGGNNCLEKNNQYKARHSKEKYVQFEHLNFDLVLCMDFWKLKNWAHPISNELGVITKCNYYCPLCQQQKKEQYSFCNQDAWHTQDDKINVHNFSCKQYHLDSQIKGINIAFVIDTTGSMQKYINMCKSTIQEIMKKAKSYKNINREELDIKFALVSYNDHNPNIKDQQIIQTQGFTSEESILQALNKLTAQGGDDEPEAVLDGLNASLSLIWNKNYEKLLYLIADAPPHGTQYTNCKDNFPKGCPCGLKQESVLNGLLNMNVKLKILKINQNINLMITEFKKDYKDLIVFTPDQEDEHNFSQLIVDDVCKCLTHNEITYKMNQK